MGALPTTTRMQACRDGLGSTRKRTCSLRHRNAILSVLVMCATKFQLLELRLLTSSNWNLAPQGLVECAWGTEGTGGHPSGPREQKNEQKSTSGYYTVGGGIAP